MRIAVTGAAGFLGWHIRTRLHALHPDIELVSIDLPEWPQLSDQLAGCDAVIHLAGINRASEQEVREGNIALANDLLAALRANPQIKVVAYSNSIQMGNGTPYGIGKGGAADALAAGCQELAVRFVDVRLPNLFGEHGRPNYNSFVPTFIEAALNGDEPTIQDRPIELLHVQDAAQVFIESVLGNVAGVVEPQGHPTSIVGVWEKVSEFARIYAPSGDIPTLTNSFDIALFNTFRAAMWPQRYPISFTKNSDDRGWLVETVRAHGSQGQTFISTTAPGVTRGEHFHLRKFERFVVLQGQARIQLRKALTDEILDFDVTGENPCAVDMPIGWTHNITNTGDTELLTVFWTNELFDAADPDTFYEKVDPKKESQ
ncbi:MAG: NAD-dependent epimerase/dehydratase family protein [Propionibacteriaceae bacterium]